MIVVDGVVDKRLLLNFLWVQTRNIKRTIKVDEGLGISDSIQSNFLFELYDFFFPFLGYSITSFLYVSCFVRQFSTQVLLCSQTPRKVEIYWLRLDNDYTGVIQQRPLTMVDCLWITYDFKTKVYMKTRLDLVRRGKWKWCVTRKGFRGIVQTKHLSSLLTTSMLRIGGSGISFT